MTKAANLAALAQGPAFSAYLGTNQSVSNSTYTKVQAGTEEFDTNANYDTSLYRFTPTVAGYYQVNAVVDPSGSAATSYQAISIYKNGSSVKAGDSGRDDRMRVCISTLIYMNGTTDYIELYGYITGTSTAFGSGSSVTYFQAFLARAA